MGIVRLLSIQKGATHDGAGRELGEDWLLADLGEGHNGAHYYLTTDQIHASKMPFRLADAQAFGAWVVDLINASTTSEDER